MQEKSRMGPPIRASDYVRCIQQFDRLWESGTTEHDQREMQRLIALINSYEACLKG